MKFIFVKFSSKEINENKRIEISEIDENREYRCRASLCSKKRSKIVPFQIMFCPMRQISPKEKEEYIFTLTKTSTITHKLRLLGRSLQSMVVTPSRRQVHNLRGLIVLFKRTMESVEAVLLALSTFGNSSREIRQSVEWESEIDGTFYRLTLSRSIKCEVLRFDTNFPRNVICFRGIFVRISILYFRSPCGGSVELFLIPRSIEVIVPDVRHQMSCLSNSSVSILAFESDSHLSRIESRAFYYSTWLKSFISQSS
jgi:hypothetical protein